MRPKSVIQRKPVRIREPYTEREEQNGEVCLYVAREATQTGLWRRKSLVPAMALE